MITDDDLYISEEAKKWITKRIEDLINDVNSQIQHLNLSYDSGTFRQTSNVLDLQAQIEMLQQKIKDYLKVKTEAKLVAEGESIDGICIGTKITFAFLGEDPETITVGTRWDAEMCGVEGQIVAFNAPLVRNAIRAKGNQAIEINGSQLRIIKISFP